VEWQRVQDRARQRAQDEVNKRRRRRRRRWIRAGVLLGLRFNVNPEM
jgi:hypothetical protein